VYLKRCAVVVWAPRGPSLWFEVPQNPLFGRIGGESDRRAHIEALLHHGVVDVGSATITDDAEAAKTELDQLRVFGEGGIQCVCTCAPQRVTAKDLPLKDLRALLSRHKVGQLWQCVCGLVPCVPRTLVGFSSPRKVVKASCTSAVWRVPQLSMSGTPNPCVQPVLLVGSLHDHLYVCRHAVCCLDVPRLWLCLCILGTPLC
jgi:hypothetical protein